ncbi:MAG: hypothetical protein K0S07_42 [Chlamydiales bacterium]|jgi:hypothetical protein|nr:hypothetical protein [Chlamydiales bacterium]
MKRKSFIFYCFLLFIASNQLGFMTEYVRKPNIIEGKPIRYYINRRNQIVDEHVAQFKKYVDAEVFGSGGGCPEKITNIHLSFIVTAPGPVDIEKAKELIIKGYQDLLYRVNLDETVRPGLNNYPFTTGNLFYSILFADKKGQIYITPAGEESLERITSCTVCYASIKAEVNSAPLDGIEVYRASIEDVLKVLEQKKPNLTQPIKEGERFQW